MATVRDSMVRYSFSVAIIVADFITGFSWLQKLASLFAVHTNIEGIHSSWKDIRLMSFTSSCETLHTYFLGLNDDEEMNSLRYQYTPNDNLA